MACRKTKLAFADGKIRLAETQLDYAEVMFKRFGMQGGTLSAQESAPAQADRRAGIRSAGR